MPNASRTDHETHVYDITTVCRLTGLTAANLRIWEKRYQAVTPTRSSSGRRQYSRRDVQRLTLLKTLVDLGHSISSSVKLPIAELERRIEETARPETTPLPEKHHESRHPHPCRICVVGGYLGTLMESPLAMPERSVKVAGFLDLDAAEREEEHSAADLLIVECPALFPGDISRVEKLIKRTNSLRAILVYSFTQNDALEILAEKGAQITAIRAPISPEEFKTICETDAALANRSAAAVLAEAPRHDQPVAGIPKRRFSGPQLASISQLSSTVDCECPRQLAGLLTNLNGFETYSAECQNRNAADAEIHAYLHETTARARAIIEDALGVLLEFEGIAPGDG